jgi:hypothetical protein
MRKFTATLAGIVLISGLAIFGYWYLSKEAQRRELQPVYEAYLTVTAKAYEDFDTGPLTEVAAGGWANAMSDSIKSLERAGVVQRQRWELVRLWVLEYGESTATIESTRKYLVLGAEGDFDDYPDYYWRTETEVCDLVQEDGQWKIDQCRIDVSGW